MKIKALHFFCHGGNSHIGPLNDLPEYDYDAGELWPDPCLRDGVPSWDVSSLEKLGRRAILRPFFFWHTD
jgi:hypothetical protein